MKFIKQVAKIEDFLTLYDINDNLLKYCCKLLSYMKIEKGKNVIRDGDVTIIDDSQDLFFILIRGKMAMRRQIVKAPADFDEFVRRSIIKRQSTKRSRVDLTRLSQRF